MGYFANAATGDVYGVPSTANILPVAVTLDYGTAIPSTSGITNSPRNVITLDSVHFTTLNSSSRTIPINLGRALGHVAFRH